MTDVGRNETVQLDEEDPSDTFDSHSAFALMSFDHLEPDTPAGHSAAHDRTFKTMPTPFDRANQDDVDRTQDDLMIQLAGQVDDHCLSALLDHASIEVTDLAVTQIDDWVRASVLEILLDTRRTCGTDLLIDGELAPFVTASHENGRPCVDVGWNRTNIYEMARHQPVEQGLYVVVNLQHVIALSSRASLFFTSHSLDEGTEYLSAQCNLAYSPRLDFHPGAVKIARILFEDDDSWRTAVRATIPHPSPDLRGNARSGCAETVQKPANRGWG